MHITEFNKRLQLIQQYINTVQHFPSTENWADLMIAAAINGLAVLPGDVSSSDIPQPICKIIAVLNSGIYYVIPADQVSHD